MLRKLLNLVAPPERSARFPRRALAEACEPRVLFSADLNPVLWSAGAAGAEVRLMHESVRPLQTEAVGQAVQARVELVFVDAGVTDAQHLIDALLKQRGVFATSSAQLEVIQLDAVRDGLTQITDVLANSHDISAIHIISHGDSGVLQLGRGVVNEQSLNQHADELRQWRNSLSTDADILLYGCDVAEGETGRKFIDLLAQLTDADVAASTNATGNATGNATSNATSTATSTAQASADWILEARHGQVQTASLFADGVAPMDGVLAISLSGSVSTGTTSGATSLSFSHTVVSGSNQVLFVSVGIDGAGSPVSSMTYGGLAMTKIGQASGNHGVEIWRLTAPIVGTANVVMNFIGTTAAVAGATTYDGVNQTTPSGALTHASGTGTTASLTVSSAVGELVMDVQYWQNNPAGGAQGGGQTQTWTQSNATLKARGSTEAGAASVVMSNTAGSSQQWEVGAISIKAASLGTLNAITVNTTNDTNDGDVSSLFALNSNRGADGVISLREAILAANNTANVGDADRILFNIPGSPLGGHVISLVSALPPISDAVVIDASSEPDFASNGNRPFVVLDGNALNIDGLELTSTSDGSTIRGLVIRNVGGDGIQINPNSNNNTIVGNYIGSLNSDGSNAGAGFRLGRNGILVSGSGNVIGGFGTLDGNVIAGTNPSTGDSDGIEVFSGTANQILGNVIGFAADRTTVISLANSAIALDTSGNIITGNLVGGGTDAGIYVNSSNNRLSGNEVRQNVGSGIAVVSGTGTTLLGNKVVSNGGLGIDLYNNGITANDAGDPDTGPNGLQNFPVLSSAVSMQAGTNVIGSFNSAANSTYRLEFFANRPSVADATHGEGERFLGSFSFTTDGSGNAAFGYLLSNRWVNSGDRVTATATQDFGSGNYGSTSEFAANVVATSSGVIVVDTYSDVADGSLGSISLLGANRGADGRISLREAISAANNTANVGGVDKIVFDFDGKSGVITPLTSLPSITQALTIDGSSEPGFAANGYRPVVVIDGNGLASDGLVLSANADGSTLRGLLIRNFDSAGILIQTDSDGNTVAGNYIGGLNTDGTAAAAGLGNSQSGIVIRGAANTIGGTSAADRNVISGNGTSGVFIESAGSISNRVWGNYIGLNATGTNIVSNGGYGVQLIDASGNIIGGGTAQTRNVIAGTNGANIDFSNGDNNTVQGNYLGTDVTGALDLNGGANTNGLSGIRLRNGSAGNTIGGLTAGTGNLISGNNGAGIEIRDAGTDNNVVLGNLIGTDVSGLVALGNSQAGIAIYGTASTNIIGGLSASARNVISGNGSGVYIGGNGSTGNVVLGNYIGTNFNASGLLGNSFDGINLGDFAANNRIGGNAAGAGNWVAGNGLSGIAADATAGAGNALLGNSVYQNVCEL